MAVTEREKKKEYKYRHRIQRDEWEGGLAGENGYLLVVSI